MLFLLLLNEICQVVQIILVNRSLQVKVRWFNYRVLCFSAWIARRLVEISVEAIEI